MFKNEVASQRNEGHEVLSSLGLDEVMVRLLFLKEKRLGPGNVIFIGVEDAI